MKNETKHEDMVDVMHHLQQYVPANTTEVLFEDVDAGENIKLYEDHFHYLLLGERVRGSK